MKILLTATAACDGSQYAQTKLINESSALSPSAPGEQSMSWEETRFLCFWIHAGSTGDFATAGEMKVGIMNGSGSGTLSDLVDLPATILTTHNMVVIDMEAAGWARDRVRALRFYCNNANVGEVLHIDDIIRSQYRQDRGAMYGKFFPIKNSISIAEGNLVDWTIDGLILSSASGDINLGPATILANGTTALGLASLTGDGKRSKWAGQITGYIGIARASAAIAVGLPVGYAANNKIAAITGTPLETEDAVGYTLEASGAADDDIFVLYVHGMKQ